MPFTLHMNAHWSRITLSSHTNLQQQVRLKNQISHMRISQILSFRMCLLISDVISEVRRTGPWAVYSSCQRTAHLLLTTPTSPFSPAISTMHDTWTSPFINSPWASQPLLSHWCYLTAPSCVPWETFLWTLPYLPWQVSSSVYAVWFMPRVPSPVSDVLCFSQANHAVCYTLIIKPFIFDLACSWLWLGQAIKDFKNSLFTMASHTVTLLAHFHQHSTADLPPVKAEWLQEAQRHMGAPKSLEHFPLQARHVHLNVIMGLICA